MCSSTWDFWAGSTPALKASAATKLFCLGTKSLHISCEVSHFFGTEFGIWAYWQYLKLHNLFLATFEGIFLCLKAKRNKKEFVAENIALKLNSPLLITLVQDLVLAL